MPTVADVCDAVVGGDTHIDTIALFLAAPSGARISELEVPNTAAGYADLVAWASQHAPGPRVVFALEGTRSHGIGCARALRRLGLAVVEIERPRRSDSARRGKSDPLDAQRAAHACLRLDADKLPTPRADGDREALRILLAARRDLAIDKTAKTNRLRALLLGGTEVDRALLQTRRAFTDTDLRAIARRRGRRDETREAAVRRAEAHRLAQAITELNRDLKVNKTSIADLVDHLAPGLTDKPGIGPVSAAQTIIAYSHHGRCHTEATYAALAGVSPLEMGSGRHSHHRLNRGGDRQLNRALHDIAKTRMRTCERTRAYVERRRAEGKTDRAIRRSLKRYIAREIYRDLRNQPALTA